MLEELEFYSLIKKLDIDKSQLEQNIAENIPRKELEVKIITNSNELNIEGDYALYLEILGTNYHKDKIYGVSIYNDKTCAFIPFEVLKENPDFLKNAGNMLTYDLKKVLYIFRNNNIFCNNN